MGNLDYPSGDSVQVSSRGAGRDMGSRERGEAAAAVDDFLGWIRNVGVHYARTAQEILTLGAIASGESQNATAKLLGISRDRVQIIMDGISKRATEAGRPCPVKNPWLRAATQVTSRRAVLDIPIREMATAVEHETLALLFVHATDYMEDIDELEGFKSWLLNSPDFADVLGIEEEEVGMEQYELYANRSINKGLFITGGTQGRFEAIHLPTDNIPAEALSGEARKLSPDEIATLPYKAPKDWE